VGKQTSEPLLGTPSQSRTRPTGAVSVSVPVSMWLFCSVQGFLPIDL
jgi:hypothetical protein